MKTRITLILCILSVLVLLTACGQNTESPDDAASGSAGTAYQKITAADGKELLENGAAFTLVDVRRADEYEAAHIPSAVNIPNESIESSQPDELPDLDETLVVYCRTGVRSKQAADKLVEIGYTDVRDMGGIADWPYDTVSGEEPGEYAKTGTDTEPVSETESVSETEPVSEGNTISDTDTDTETVSESNTAVEAETVSETEAGSESNTAAEAETVSESNAADETEPVNESDTAAVGLMGSFSAKDLDGNDIDQSIFAQYDLTMVNVWATYCGPCISEMPELGELADEYDSKGVRIVGMVSDALNSDGTASDSQLATARDIVAQTGADYLHIVPTQDLFGLLSQITAVPTTFFVDSSGTQVGSAYLGSRSKTQWNDIIVQMLEETRK